MYLLFFAATFMTQITILNMLIAIMGDTFERVIENKDINATKTKLQLTADLASILRTKSNQQEPNMFLYVVTPADGMSSDSDSWEGVIKTLNNFTAAQISGLETNLSRQLNKLQQMGMTEEQRDIA